MKRNSLFRFNSHVLNLSVVCFLLLLIAPGCQKAKDPTALPGSYDHVYLVSNKAGYSANRTDSLLVNPWGLTFNAGGIAWIGAQGAGVSTVYDKDGIQLRQQVAIPSPTAATGGSPTGVVSSGSATDFMLSNGQPARFIFVGTDGVLSAWNPTAGNSAFRLQNNSATSAYTGLALASDGGSSFLYAANFRAGRIDVFDKNFAAVSKSLTDPYIPAGYSPFNVQAVGQNLFVTYAKVGPNGRDQAGKGNGYVNMFAPNGTLLKRFASKGELNSPWGVTAAPASFFADSTSNFNFGQGGILIGNFGDGHILAYRNDGVFLGNLRWKGNTIVQPGLWALSFAPSTSTIDRNRLYFTAGPNGEKDGLFGYFIRASTL